MIIFDQHKKAIAEAIKAAGGAGRFAAISGIPRPTVYAFSRDIKTVNEKTWQKLEPFIRPYLKEPTTDNDTFDEITAATVEEMKALTPENRRKVFRFAVETRIDQENKNPAARR